MPCATKTDRRRKLTFFAVRRPLGLQVRAANLLDLIYKRGQAGVTRASVTIVFDNSDKSQSPVGFEKMAEISVTRQVRPRLRFLFRCDHSARFSIEQWALSFADLGQRSEQIPHLRSPVDATSRTEPVPERAAQHQQPKLSYHAGFVAVSPPLHEAPRLTG